MKSSLPFRLMLLLTATPLLGADPTTLSPSDRKALLEEGRFHEVRRKADLPIAILNLCTDGGGAMAEPGQPWQVTDVIMDATLPGRRLIWGAIGGDCYVVHYETGGIAHIWHFLVATLPKGAVQPKVIWRQQGNVQCKDFKAFAETLRADKFAAGNR